ncbi:hypothetical protein ATY79_02270 [Rhizobium sp. R693]|nr:hypothetical protein ATY79_02270 [Rhizobium sp. R693]
MRKQRHLDFGSQSKLGFRHILLWAYRKFHRDRSPPANAVIPSNQHNGIIRTAATRPTTNIAFHPQAGTTKILLRIVLTQSMRRPSILIPGDF